MNRKTMIAVAIQLLAMTWVVLPPMWVARTGTVAWLETEKMDPRALFRGDYVILGYKRAQGIVPADMAQRAQREGHPVYVTFTTDRPGAFVDVGLERPQPRDGQVCIVGRVRLFRPVASDSGAAPQPQYAVDFPQIAQYFVAEGEGREIESARGENLLARVAVNDRCEAVLLGLEQR
jgi:uncharacterized membrane-anchored protein